MGIALSTVRMFAVRPPMPTGLSSKTTSDRQAALKLPQDRCELRLTSERPAEFLDRVEVNPDADGFGDEHLLATSPLGRGSFLDMIDDNGPDSSRAVIQQIFVDKGSGPLHTIIRIEGEYQYNRADNPSSPFVTRVHAYAGRSYIRVYHSIVYTGTPDRSEPLGDRQHPAVATRLGPLVDEQARLEDTGMTEPLDMIMATGFTLSPALSRNPD